MVLNPDVVGAIARREEKCSLCVQRIQAGKLAAKHDGRPLADGDIRTACQQACPARRSRLAISTTPPAPSPGSSKGRGTTTCSAISGPARAALSHKVRHREVCACPHLCAATARDVALDVLHRPDWVEGSPTLRQISDESPVARRPAGRGGSCASPAR